MAAVNFAAPDRVPVIAQVFGHAAAAAQVPLDDYVRSGDLIARCQIKAWERYGYDAVFALMDVCVETEALGSKLIYRRNQYPDVRSYAFSTDTNLDHVAVPNPHEAGRMPELLKAIEILRTETGDQVLIVGCVLGPMTLATQLVGIEPALYMAIDEPDKFACLLDFSTEVIKQYGVAQIEAGAHLPIVFEPSGSPAVIPSQFFREFVLPRLQRVLASFKEAGGVANWLHIAGPVESILPFYPQAGVDIANFDFCVDPSTARISLPQTCLDGNVKPLLFVEGTPEMIAAESARLLDFFSEQGGFILSSGCEIPPESNPENVAAMVMATHDRR